MNFRAPAPDLPVRDHAGRPSTYLFRVATACYRANASGDGFADDILKAAHPTDRVSPLLLKAATSPMALASSPLAAHAVADFFVGLAPQCAVAALAPHSMRIGLTDRAGVTIPLRIVDAADAGKWVAEGGPIPAVQPNLSAGPTLAPRKIACIVSLTNELAAHSNAETVIRQMLSEAAALAIDAKVFSTDAEVTDVSPAGILAGVTPIAPTAGGGIAAFAGDLENLVGALADAGGGTAPVFICSPELAVTVKLLAGPKFDYPILASSAVAAATIIAIEGTSFVIGFDPVPEFRTSTETVLHQDTAATAISTAGTPNAIASPVRSLFQTNCISIRTILRASFAMRAAGHVQFITAATW
jgi:hypothetical protein